MAWLAEFVLGRWRALRRWPFSLTTKIVILVLIAVTPALVIQAYNEYDLRQSREDDIRNKTIQITRQFGAEMGEIREGARQYLQVLSQLPALNDPDTTACTRLLSALNARVTYYSQIGVVDAAGHIRCVSKPTTLTSVADLPFFKRAMAQTDLAVGNYWVDPTTGEKQIHFALPLSSQPGSPTIGVVFVGLSLDWLADHLKERGLTPTQSILIADREGNIIARLPNGAQLVGKNMRAGHAAIMDGNTAGWEESVGVDGVVRIFGYVPPSLPPRDLFLSAGESKDAAFAAIDHITQRGILLILVSLVLACYAASVGGQLFIKRPVQALLDAVRAWREGNYAARARLADQSSEIGQLGLAFNDMADAVAHRDDAQRAAESRLQELNQTLEQRVDERTRELVAANRAKAQFLANMSHEIRTPMNGIVGMIELMHHTPLTEQQRGYLDLTQRSADMMVSLISGILDLSRIEAGKFELEKVPFDLGLVLRDAIKLHEAAARPKGLRLTLTLSTNVPVALIGDPMRLGQILNNLVGNAIKFTDQGKIDVNVTLQEATSDTATIRCEVRDTGIGISEDDLKIIFNAFTQADSSDTRRFSGSGLGLSICKDLCTLMGGSIGASSELGAGSAFWFTARFGLRTDSVVAFSNGLGPDPTTTMPTNAAPPAVRCGRHALVAEDNAINAKVAAGVLEALGWTSEIARDGSEAVEAHAQRRFDIIFMDCQMPKVDGFEATTQIRAREAENGSHTRIVALTATADDAFRKRCLESGMDDYVAKPLSIDRMAAVLAKVA